MRISDWSSDVCSSDLIDIVEVGGDEVVVAVDRVVRHVDRIFFAAQQHLAPKFVARFLEGRIEAVDRDFGVLARLPLDQRGRAEAFAVVTDEAVARDRSEEHTSELQSLMRISYAVF